MKITVKWSEVRGEGFVNPFQIMALKDEAKVSRITVLDFLADAKFEIERLYNEILEQQEPKGTAL